MAPTVTVLHHLETPFLGHARRALEGVCVTEHHLGDGDTLPAIAAIDGLISLGGEQSVTELHRYPYLEAEVGLLRAAVRAQTPVLGVCLGGQLLAHALGAEVRRMPRRMIGWEEVRPLDAGHDDALLGSLPAGATALHWNEDCFALPAGAVELAARPGPGCEAFRHGPTAWGIQFHPEVDAEVLESWYRLGEGWLEQAGVTEAQARAADARNLAAQERTGAALFSAFAGRVRERAAAAARP